MQLIKVVTNISMSSTRDETYAMKWAEVNYSCFSIRLRRCPPEMDRHTRTWLRNVPGSRGLAIEFFILRYSRPKLFLSHNTVDWVSQSMQLAHYTVYMVYYVYVIFEVYIILSTTFISMLRYMIFKYPITINYTLYCVETIMWSRHIILMYTLI